MQLLTLVLSVLCLVCIQCNAAPSPATNLLLEYMPSPVFGIDVANPRASWTIPASTDQRALSQSAYQIWVSSDPNVPRGDVWDSGRKSSNASVLIPLQFEIAADTTYYWKVNYWDQSGAEAGLSTAARFDTGLLSSSDWAGARWIGGANQLRKEFQLSSVPSSAKVYISGIGYYELYINGKKVSDNVLDVPWTNYKIRAAYRVHDITSFLQTGANAIAVTLGNGWWGMKAGNGGQRMLIARVTATSGSTKSTILVTDNTWSVHAGPVTFDSVYDGESYDARMETPGWTSPGYKQNWQTPTVFPSGPGGALKATIIYPVKIANELKPIKMTQIRPGVYIYDFGQNMSGFCKLSVKGSAGTEVTLRHAEVLDKTGNLYVTNLRSAKATDTYILKGDSNGEVYQPRFTYHGFRFVELTGFPGTPTADTLTAHHVYSSVPTVGQISLGNPVLNQIQKNIWWGQTSNLMSVPTDCDQRDERLGWMADGHLSAEEALYNFDMGGFYSNWVDLMHDDQGQDGTVTDVVPYIRYGGRPADPSWGAAYPLLVYWIHKYKGDTRVLTEHYNGVKAWIDYLTSRVKSSGIAHMYASYGDWVPPPPADKCNNSLTSSFFFLLNIQQLSEIAGIIGNSADQQKYSQLYSQYARDFNTAFYSASKKNYANGLQTCMVLPLTLDIVPDSKGVLNSLLDDITKQNTHLTTGIIGTKYLMSALSAQGRQDVAVKLATQITYPSWGYMFSQNDEAEATTLWELWNSPTGDPGMDSRNHIMFGSIGAWFYETLGGIKTPKSPGFNEIVIRPPDTQVLLQSPLHKVSAKTNTPYGDVSSAWEISGGVQCRQILPRRSTTIGCGSNGGVITQIYPSSDCSATIPATDLLVHIKDALVNCVGKSECVVPAVAGLSGEDRGTPFLKATCSASPQLRLQVQIASNTIGYVHVNKLNSRNPLITESGQSVWAEAQLLQTPGILSAEESDDHVIFKVGSGSYDFHVIQEPGKLVCGVGSASKPLSIECPVGLKVSMVSFASYGNPIIAAEGGICGAYGYGDFHAGSSIAVIEDLCLNQNRCEVNVARAFSHVRAPLAMQELSLGVAVYCS